MSLPTIQIKYTRPPLYPYQTEIINSESRYTCTEAATKTGKTASHIVWLFEQALKCKKNQSVWWVAPVFAQSKVAFDRMKDQITDRNIFNANETNQLITLINGAKIQFKSGEKPDNLYGDDVYAICVDEASRMREASWHALRTTVTSTGGKIKFIGNVRGRKNWYYQMCVRARAGEDANYKYFKITAYDAANAGMMTKEGKPFIEEIEAAKRDLPESVFKELYLAEASEDGSNPFGYKFIQLCAIGLSSLPAVCYGIDLAKSSDYTVIIGLDKFGQVCHFDRFQKDWLQTVQTIKMLPNLPMKIDSTGVGDPIVEQVQSGRGNVNSFKFTQQSKQQIMEGLALGIQQRKVLFPEGVIKDELENFEFEYTRTGVRYTAPEGIHDDCVCALALAYDLHKNAIHVGNYNWV